MKPLAARACARPLTAPSTMTLLEQPNHARCAINCRIHRSLRSEHGRVRRRVTVPPLVGSLAARPIPSLCWREMDANFRFPTDPLPFFEPAGPVSHYGLRQAFRSWPIGTK